MRLTKTASIVRVMSDLPRGTFLVGPPTEASKTSMRATSGRRHGTSAAPSRCSPRSWRRAQSAVASLTLAVGRANTRSWSPLEA